MVTQTFHANPKQEIVFIWPCVGNKF